jgi:hypothetical protein
MRSGLLAAVVPALVLVGPTAASAAAGGRDVTPYGALGVVVLLLGILSLRFLGSWIGAWLRDQSTPAARALRAGINLGVSWGFAAALAALVLGPKGSDPAGAASALLLIVGVLGLGSYGLVLGLVTVFAAFRFRPERPDAPWSRDALVTGVLVAVFWMSPILLMGAEAVAGDPVLALGLFLGVCLFSMAVVLGAFWRARQTPPVEKWAPIPGVPVVCVLCLAWGLVVPLASVGLLGWFWPGDESWLDHPLTRWIFVVSWIPPLLTIAGLLLAKEIARRAALVLFAIAVVVFGLHLLWDLQRGDGSLLPLLLVPVLLLCGWPLRHLSRKEIRQRFGSRAGNG